MTGTFRRQKHTVLIHTPIRRKFQIPPTLISLKQRRALFIALRDLMNTRYEMYVERASSTWKNWSLLARYERVDAINDRINDIKSVRVRVRLNKSHFLKIFFR